jgi:hypothetical protein
MLSDHLRLARRPGNASVAISSKSKEHPPHREPKLEQTPASRRSIPGDGHSVLAAATSKLVHTNPGRG